jgi:hypothetical protein
MEKCKNVLKGYDVEPVEMMDNGDSSDLELFYRCKKAAEELAYLNDELLHLEAEDFLKENRKKVGSVEFEVKFNANPAIKSMQELSQKFREFAQAMNLSVLEVGTEIFYLSKGRIHKSVVEDLVGLVSENGMPVCKVKANDNAIPATYLYDSAVRLASHVGKTVSDHISLSSDKESAYFIDQTSRVFKGAKWYLEDQKIVNFASINDLRGYLITHIVDDTQK